jgi:PAS domain S-box-containing protein
LGKLHLILFLLISQITGIALGQLYTFRNFNHKDGLSIATVTALQASKDGNIWLGTDGAGLIRFNGFKFEELGISGNNRHHISSLTFHSDSLYFFSRYKGIYRQKGRKIEELLAANKFKGEGQKIQSIPGSLMFTTNKGIYLLQNSKLETLKSFTGESSASEILLIPNGALILTNAGNFHYSFLNKRLIPLKNWLRSKSEALDKLKLGYCHDQKVVLTDDKMQTWIEIILDKKDGIYSMKKLDHSSALTSNERIVSLYFDPQGTKTILLTSEAGILIKRSGDLKRIALNYDRELKRCHTVITDINGDIWVASEINGLYKISEEPFTKVMLHPVYSMPDILCLHKSQRGDILISTHEDKTYLGNIYRPESDFITFPFRTLSCVETKEHIWLATNQGVKRVKKGEREIIDVQLAGTAGERIDFIYVHQNELFIGVHKKGLKRYMFPNLEEKPINGKKLPEFVYTAQYSKGMNTLLFGTNEGIFRYVPQSGSLERHPDGLKNGYYCGVSTTDIFGTCWFTGDNGLTGFTSTGETVVISDDQFFNSKLFYTLNSDNFGQLIIGTNKGINILKLDELGNVLKQSTYTGQTGFGGYETNMRAQYQDQNSIFVGTIEGLFMINTEVLRNFPKPTAPVISSAVQKTIDNQENSFAFEFSTNNPKISHLYYTYRVRGFQEEWSELSEVNKILLSNLPNGNYTLEVRSTYDGVIYSDTGFTDFKVHRPFWKSRWFIVVLIILIVLVNILIISRRKTFEGGNFFKTKDSAVELTMTPAIILFAFFAVIISTYIAPIVDPAIPSMMGVTVVTGFILLSLYFFTKSEESAKRSTHSRLILITAYTIVMIHFLYGAFISKLQPFFVVAMAIAMAIVPFVFEKLKHVVIQGLILLIISSLYILLVQDTVYNKFLFLLMVLISSSLSVFSTYMRYDSLEKLIFISGVINKGNVHVISFNESGIITYVSENISDIIPVTHQELLYERISTLNGYLPDDNRYRGVDLTTQYFDGQKYLVPMLNGNGGLNWIEWSCKVFSAKVNVIIGQNVSDRMELENTYEMLVENAEDLIYQTDVNGKLHFMNRQFYKALEYAPGEIDNWHALDLVHPDYREGVEAFYKEHFQQLRNTSYFEFPIVSKSGKEIWIGQHVTTLFKQGLHDHVNGFLALARDITLQREQNRIIEEQRDNITSSITYAKRIQLNLQPEPQAFDQSFGESFVIYRPKDIVSGDFYWCQRIDDRSVIVLADCTGHGVPGAFMTLLGINLLNNIVLENRVIEPSEILNQLDKRLLDILGSQQGREEISDGMEMTVLQYDHSNEQLSFACAGSRFLIYEKNSFNMYKGDIKHIGDKADYDFNGYVTHSLNLGQDSTLYLLTDGFQDQFGGNKDKKFSFRRVLETFEENIRLPLNEQSYMIEEEFEKWKQDAVQTDDVTIIALRYPKK